MLRAARVIDQHLKAAKVKKPETTLGLKTRDSHGLDEEGIVRLFGYQMEPVRENEEFHTNYFLN